jgi:purine-binding chemotaxis protein CheW
MDNKELMEQEHNEAQEPLEAPEEVLEESAEEAATSGPSSSSDAETEEPLPEEAPGEEEATESSKEQEQDQEEGSAEEEEPEIEEREVNQGEEDYEGDENEEGEEEKDTVAHDASVFLTFMQGNEKYALDIDIVREVLGEADVTPIPLVPHYIRGVVNLRGYVIPVVDLCWLFYARALELTRYTTIIIVEMKNEDDSHTVGVMVDSLDEVMTIAEEDIDPAPDFGSKIKPEYIAGIARSDDTYTIILNGKELFNMDRLADFYIEG